jgi:beta-ureidopropionase / N-carbamoyl-L-amino-acid hydrolase
MTDALRARNRRASDAVQGERLWRRLMEMAQIGATPKGGVNRQALSSEDAAARKLLASWAVERGYATFADTIGNIFVVRPGREPGLEPVLSGSHLDTQPTGGKFDGAYGVLAAFEVLEALDDAGITTRRPLAAVAWTNEEGNRFQPGCMGSGVFARQYSLDAMRAAVDRDGVSIAAALDQVQAAAPLAQKPIAFPVAAYIEAHIEQGPILENTGQRIGAVTLIQGIYRYLVEVTGEEAHAGTTPLALRKDALKAAAAMVGALEAALDDPTDTLRFTIGRFETYPGSPSTVPSRVQFIIDLRHPDAAEIRARGALIEPTVAAHARGCAVSVSKIADVAPTPFRREVIDLVRESSLALGYATTEMLSGAGHDAMHLAKVCPTGMIFVPCLRGVSHNEAESATPDDLTAGTRVLADTLVALAER